MKIKFYMLLLQNKFLNNSETLTQTKVKLFFYGISLVWFTTCQHIGSVNADYHIN